jgi:peptidyl-Asp metalloendopeptidase
MIIGNDSSCGIGYVNSAKSYAFSVIQAACATGVYSYGHEIGHNFNMNHDRGTEGKCNTTGTGSSYGYRTPDASFRSILASNCKTNVCGNMTKKDCTVCNVTRTHIPTT